MEAPALWGQTRRWWALGALVVCVLVIGLDTTILYVALPDLVAALHATNSELQWVLNSYLLIFAGLMLPAGALADRWGRKRMLMAGLILFGLSSAAAAMADTAAALIAARGVMGVGAAIVMPVSLSMLPVLFAPEERARALAIWSGGVALGLPIGPLAGGWLLENYWWGSVFLINVPIVLVAVLAGWWLFPESRNRDAARMDLVGAGLSTVGLVATTYAVTEAQTLGWSDPVTLGAFGAGLAMLAVFVLAERRAAVRSLIPARARHGRHSAPVTPAPPMIDLELFANRTFAVSTSVLTLVYFALMGFLFLLTPFLQAVRGMTALGTGVQLLPLVGALMVGALTADVLATRTGPRGPVTLGMLMVGAGQLMFLRVDGGTAGGYLSGSLVVIGVGVGLTLATALHVALATLPDHKSGLGSGLTSAFRQIGGAFGVAVVGSVLGTHYREAMQGITQGLPPDLTAAAQDEIGSAMAIADALGPAGSAIRDGAVNAYTDGMRAALLVGTAVALTAAVLAAIGLRRRLVAAPPRHRGPAVGHGSTGRPPATVPPIAEPPAVAVARTDRGYAVSGSGTGPSA